MKVPQGAAGFLISSTRLAWNVSNIYMLNLSHFWSFHKWNRNMNPWKWQAWQQEWLSCENAALFWELIDEWRCFQKRNRLLGIFWLLCHQTFKPDFLLFEKLVHQPAQAATQAPRAHLSLLSLDCPRNSSKQPYCILLPMLLGIPSWIHHMLLWTNSGGFHFRIRTGQIWSNSHTMLRRETLDVCEELSKIWSLGSMKISSLYFFTVSSFDKILMTCSFFIRVHRFDINHTLHTCRIFPSEVSLSTVYTAFHLLYPSPCSVLRLNHLWENIWLGHFAFNRPNRHHGTSVPRAEADHTLLSRILKGHSTRNQYKATTATICLLLKENWHYKKNCLRFCMSSCLRRTSGKGPGLVQLCEDGLMWDNLGLCRFQLGLGAFQNLSESLKIGKTRTVPYKLVANMHYRFIHFQHIVKTGSACFSAQSSYFGPVHLCLWSVQRFLDNLIDFRLLKFWRSFVSTIRSTEWWYLRDWYQSSIFGTFMPNHAKLQSAQWGCSSTTRRSENL